MSVRSFAAEQSPTSHPHTCPLLICSFSPALVPTHTTTRVDVCIATRLPLTMWFVCSECSRKWGSLRKSCRVRSVRRLLMTSTGRWPRRYALVISGTTHCRSIPHPPDYLRIELSIVSALFSGCAGKGGQPWLTESCHAIHGSQDRTHLRCARLSFI